MSSRYIGVNNNNTDNHSQGYQHQKPPGNLAQDLATADGRQTMFFETVGVIHVLLSFLAMMTATAVMMVMPV